MILIAEKKIMNTTKRTVKTMSMNRVKVVKFSPEFVHTEKL